jgi:hypothetical protein
MRFISVVPLLLIPTLIYAMLAVANGPTTADALRAVAMAFPMPSNTRWEISWGHLIVIIAVICLFIEVVKSSRPSQIAMVDNALSVVMFVLCLIFFILIPGFGTSEFFILLIMCILDFVAGFVIMTHAAQRTVTFGSGGGGGN